MYHRELGSLWRDTGTPGFTILNSSLPPPPLLVHLSPRGDTINGHEEQLLRLDDLEENAEVVEDVLEYLLLRNSEMRVGVIRVRAVVDDAIHVQIHVIEVWYLRVFNVFRIVINFLPCLNVFRCLGW